MEVRLVSARTLLVQVGRYALSLLLSTLGVWFSVGIFDATVVTPALGRDTAKEIAVRPPYPLLIMIGLLIGHISVAPLEKTLHALGVGAARNVSRLGYYFMVLP